MKNTLEITTVQSAKDLVLSRKPAQKDIQMSIIDFWNEQRITIAAQILYVLAQSQKPALNMGEIVKTMQTLFYREGDRVAVPTGFSTLVRESWVFLYNLNLVRLSGALLSLSDDVDRRNPEFD